MIYIIINLNVMKTFLSQRASLRGSPPTGAHFGPKKGYMLGSLFKQARCKIVICVLYNSVVE